MSTRPAADAVPCQPTVIIVDDEAADRSYVGAVVRKMGLNRIEASSLDDVKRIAAEHKDALIVLDVMLGEDDASDVLEALAAERFTGGIILISAHERTVMDWVYGLGARMKLKMLSTLRKPITPDALRAGIRAAGQAALRAAAR